MPHLVAVEAPPAPDAGADADAIAASMARLHAAIEGGPAGSGVGRDLVERAAALAIEAHAGMRRKSGDPYAVHPIETAAILARMQLDGETLAAALLHDVIEDTGIPAVRVEEGFGARVLKLVDGVTKLGQIPWSGEATVEGQASREQERQAESLRKMFLAMVDDIGVVLIKLADRLHNMRTLDAMPRHKQVRIAQQTMEIYAPLANRLGIWQLKSELEDLGFRYLHPEEYHALQSDLEQRGRDRAVVLERVKTDLNAALAENGIKAELSGRGKHVYSIWRKMRQKGRRFDEIYDVIGIRVIVADRKDCYGALGVIHTMWHPVPGEFDDYIATPKE
ncbi:MAG: Guanosine-3',5'-bis(diphosphate) 3'-pyrophosphohydrolase / GTP pyrophosphokinase, (p)ppGpp synthetase II, partial [uncultured Thermomicrobiales bacterium]